MESGGTIILTGAAGGLGKAVTKQLIHLKHPFHAILTVRDAQDSRAQSLHQLLQNDERFRIESLELDTLANVRAFAVGINTRISSGQLKPIHTLVLNAGYMSSHAPSFTKDGYEKAFQVNYLVNFLLIHQLLPSMNRDHGRIIFVTSFSHDPENKYAKHLPLPKSLWQPADIFAKPPLDKENKSKAGFRRYAASKMCSMMLMHAVQARLDVNEKWANIVVLAVDPGCVGATNIMREQNLPNRFVIEKVLNFMTPLLQRLSPNGLFRTRSRSARDILNACIGTQGPAIGKDSKAMIANGSRLQQSSNESRNTAKQELLWKGSAKLVGLTAYEAEMLDLPQQLFQ